LGFWPRSFVQICDKTCQTCLEANQPWLTQLIEVFIFNKHLGCYNLPSAATTCATTSTTSSHSPTAWCENLLLIPPKICTCSDLFCATPFFSLDCLLPLGRRIGGASLERS
jgi:hypothetical protein